MVFDVVADDDLYFGAVVQGFDFIHDAFLKKRYSVFFGGHWNLVGYEF